jgi:beta-barrel assembly-enhancing protease
MPLHGGCMREVDFLLGRRDFLRLAAAGTLAAAAGTAGCAANPVTGQRQLMLISEDQEIAADRRSSPHQISADYGQTQDQHLNSYVAEVGRQVAAKSHRPHMPYSFRVVNATYVNAYAFPGGTIATTRGIMLGLTDEAQLAALLGHEIGHVSARHTATRMSKAALLGLAVSGVSVVAGDLGAGLGALGGGILLAHYSREDERQADDLGMEYMVGSGRDPQGMVGLMDMLRSMHKDKPGALQTMFSTHPMGEERYQTARRTVEQRYAGRSGLTHGRERYMDSTAGLRRIKPAIEAFQAGEKEMAAKQYAGAEEQFRKGLQAAPGDYAGLLLMAKCQLMRERAAEGVRYASEARQAYPAEPQAHLVLGLGQLMAKRYDAALQEFTAYDVKLPGNPNTLFLKGRSLEGMGRIPDAAREYNAYLQQVREGQQAQYAYKRLVEWGYIKPQK